MPNAMAAMPNTGGAPVQRRSLADVHYQCGVLWRCKDAKPIEIRWGPPNSPTDLSR